MEADKGVRRYGRFSGAYGRAIDAVTVLLLGVAVWTLLRNRQPRAADPVSVEQPTVGRMLPTLRVVDSNLQRRALLGTESTTPYLVLVFRTDCPYCRETRAVWQTLAAFAAIRHIPTIALTAEPMTPTVKDYFDATDITPFQFDNPSIASATIGVRIVPTTLVVGPRGKVLRQYNGLLNDDAVKEVRATLARLALSDRGVSGGEEGTVGSR